MMAGNFQQMGNAGGNPMMMQQQAQGPNSNHVQMQMLLLQQIRANSQPPVGWQATVAEQERLRYTLELVTQLRLATNPASQDLTKICRMGLDFEKQAYESAPDKDTYVKLITGKLGQLTNARTMGAQQMAQQQQQMGMASQAGGMGQPFQPGMQQLNMQHLQQQMQPSPMQGQQQPQQIPMGMGNNIMGQNILPNAQFQMNMQQQQQQQQQVQMQAQQGGQPRPHPPLTQPEQQICLQLAKQMMAQTSEQEKQNLRARAQASMTPEQWERSQALHVDPLQQYFHTQAVKRFRMQRAAQMSQRQSGQGMPMGMNRQPGAIPMQQQRSGNPNPMVPQPQQGQQLGIPGNPEFAFLDQQQQNQNPQDGNQLGMQPSLSQQGNTTPQNMAGLPVQSVTPNQQRIGQNPQMVRQQQFNAQQQAQAQAQAQEKARRAQMAALQGQPGGLGGMPPNQSPAMNTLNAPLAGTPQQNAGGQGPAVSQPGPSQFGQPIDPRFAGMTRPGVNGQMPYPNGMSAEQRQKFSQLPPEKFDEMLTKWHQQRAMQDQANGLAGGMPGGGQMMQNPGGPQPQPGQQGMANPMNQFMPNGGQPMQRPPSQMPPGMTTQQQALLRQQMQQRQMQQTGAPQPQGPGGEQSGGLDNLDFPPGIYTIIPRQLIPQGITKWGQLKQWILAHGANGGLDVGGVMEKASQLQRSQMQQLLQRRSLQQQNQQRAAAGLPPLPPQQPGQPGQLAMTPQMAQQLAQMQQMQGPITPQDVENARNHNSGRWVSLNDEQIRQQLMIQRRNQHIALLQRQQQQQMQQQQQNQQFNQQQMGMPGMPQMPGQNMPNGMMRPNGAPPQQGQPGVPPQMKRLQPNQHGVPQKPLTAPPMEQKQIPQQRATKPTQPTSSPAQAPNSKKRASSDDVVEVPNPSAQVNRPQMKPGQPGMQRPPSFVQPTPEQLAAMPPDKKQKYMQFIMQQRQRQMAAMGPQPTQADMQEFSRIRTDEGAKWKPPPPVQMTSDERAQALQSLQQAGRINQVFNIAPKWFAMKKNEQRLRAFFRAHLSINGQFEDGAKVQRPKAALSMKASEIGQAMAIANSMVQDVAAKHPEMMKARQAGQQPSNAAGPSQQGQQQQFGPAPAPLNAANLQQQQQALSQAQKEQQKSQMQRASISNTKAPPAPTTTHAPNLASGGAQPGKAQSVAQHASPANQPQFAVNSPQGVPALYGPKAIDQGQLRLPPNKRKKTDGGMASAGNTPAQASKSAPGQQNQNGGQPMMKTESQQEAKAQTNGQQAEQAQPQATKQQGFVCTDRDCEGQLAPFPTEEALEAHNQEQHKKPMADAIPFLMDVMGDFLGLDEEQKPEATAPEVKQDAKPSPSQKSKDVKPQQDPWAASGVNPQELMAVFKPFETGASGAISNVDAYRSISPNDTPESMESDKTHPSDPNSDITEGTALDITMQFEEDKNWDPFGEGDMDAFTIGEPPKEIDADPRPIGQRGDNEMVYNELPGSEAPEDNMGWDDMVQWEEPDKPFSFDSSLFEMDAGISMF